MAAETGPDIATPVAIYYIVFGMFLWDYFATIWLELYFIVGKLKLRWPMIPYFLARYSALGFTLTGLLFQMSRKYLDCDALLSGNVILGKIAVTSASVNVLVRTAIIWSYRWYIVYPLGMLVSGQVIIACIGFWQRSVLVTWNNDLQMCNIQPISQDTNLGIFASYALCVDCIIVSLTIIGLRKFDSKSNFTGVLIRQGIGFFLLVLLFQTFVTATLFSRGNSALAPTSAVLCAVIVPMVSCHMVRSILSSSSSGSGSSVSEEGPTADPWYSRRDGVQLTTHVELGSSSSEQ